MNLGLFFIVSKNFHKAIAKASGNDIEYLCYHFFKLVKDISNILGCRGFAAVPPARRGFNMAKKIVVIPGDGIGSEITGSAVEVLKKAEIGRAHV